MQRVKMEESEDGGREKSMKGKARQSSHLSMATISGLSSQRVNR